MSLIRLRSREWVRIKPSLIRNRVHRSCTIELTMIPVWTALSKFRYLLSAHTSRGQQNMTWTAPEKFLQELYLFCESNVFKELPINIKKI